MKQQDSKKYVVNANVEYPVSSDKDKKKNERALGDCMWNIQTVR